VELPSPAGQRPAAGRSGLYDLSPRQFERYVAAIFRRKGYQVRLTGGSGDHGVDLELHDLRSSRRAIVQCKRYQNTVGEELVRELYGTLLHELAYHAFLVTTADISDAAREWAQGKPITLIDGAALVEIDAALFAEAPEE
jgi:restriction system protein